MLPYLFGAPHPPLDHFFAFQNSAGDLVRESTLGFVSVSEWGNVEDRMKIAAGVSSYVCCIYLYIGTYIYIIEYNIYIYVIIGI